MQRREHRDVVQWRHTYTFLRVVSESWSKDVEEVRADRAAAAATGVVMEKERIGTRDVPFVKG